jgi:DNA-binding PadR family transcriptional regulator
MSVVRILILGVLNDQKPRHGYEVKQILESWNADKWANIGYGSIYFALRKMSEEGLLTVIENQEGKQDKTVYQITEAGSNAFMVTLRKQWLQLKPTIDPFQVALTFMQYLSKDELLTALEHRADTWRHIIKTSPRMLPMALKDMTLPKHIDENHSLILAHYQTELDWIEGAIEKVKNNELA